MKFFFLLLFIIYTGEKIYAFPFHPANDQRSKASDQHSTGINRPSYYKALEENSRALVDSQLVSLQTAPAGLKEAFEGALTMKKASFGGNAHAKLKLFKDGRKKLEKAIRENPENVEFRFLRLIIQEHAPGILGYRNDIEVDRAYISKMYKSLPDDVQQAIFRYNKKSKVLKLDLS